MFPIFSFIHKLAQTHTRARSNQNHYYWIAFLWLFCAFLLFISMIIIYGCRRLLRPAKCPFNRISSICNKHSMSFVTRTQSLWRVNDGKYITRVNEKVLLRKLDMRIIHRTKHKSIMLSWWYIHDLRRMRIQMTAINIHKIKKSKWHRWFLFLIS